MTFSLSLKNTKSLVKNTHLLTTGTSVTLRFQSISVGHLGTEFTTVILLSDEVFPAKSNTFFGPCSKLYDMKPTDQNGKITTNIYTCGFHPWLFIQIGEFSGRWLHPIVTFVFNDLYFPELSDVIHIFSRLIWSFQISIVLHVFHLGKNNYLNTSIK